MPTPATASIISAAPDPITEVPFVLPPEPVTPDVTIAPALSPKRQRRKPVHPKKPVVTPAVTVVPASLPKRRRGKPVLPKKPARKRAVSARRPPRAHKARGIKLKASASIDDAMAIIFSACRDHWKENIQAARVAGHSDGLHQVRVGLRRFRTALILFRDYLPSSQREYFNREAKVLNETLGPARDLDVFTKDLGQLAGAPGEDSSVATVVRAAAKARTATRRMAASMLRGARYRRLMARLDSWIADRRWRIGSGKENGSAEQVSGFARKVLNKRISKIRKQSKKIAARHPDVLHELRIVIKKARYALEFFATTLPAKRTSRTASQLKTLQDSLGRLNDLVVAQRTMKALKESAVPAKRKAIKKGNRELISRLKSLAMPSLPKAVRAAARLRALQAL